VFAVAPAAGTYSLSQTLLLDLTGPLGGDGKATWRQKRKERKGKRGTAKGGVALAPRKNPEGIHVSIYY